MATKLIKPNWQNTGQGNLILQGDGFYVSYNPNPGESDIGKMYNKIGKERYGLEAKAEETALVNESDATNYHILNGDFRKEYETAFPLGFAECKKVFDKHKDKDESDWSTEKALKKNET